MQYNTIISPSCIKKNLSLYKIPLIRENKRLSGLYFQDNEDIINLDLDLDSIDWSNTTILSILKQVYINFNEDIIAVY